MTRSELILATREELLDDVADAQAGTDLTVQAVSDARLGRWLLEGEREACRRRFNLIFDDAPRITLRTGIRSYRLDSLILRLQSVYYNGVRLVHTTEQALDRDVTGWRDYEDGAPTAFYINNHRLILDHTPTTTENGTLLSLSVWREPHTSDDLEEEPEIPASLHHALTNWAAYRYFLMPDPHIRDDARAVFFLQQFELAFGPARSAALLEFKLEDPGWSDIGTGGYRAIWPATASTDLTSF